MVDIPQAMIEAAARALRDNDGVLDNWLTLARAALAAAFAECEVREEFRSTKPYVLPWGIDPYAQRHRWDERRLVITTPPVVVTPAQEEAANG